VSLLLNIDTSAAVASVSISSKGKLLACIQNEEQNEHASFIQPAIKKLLLQLHLKINELDAVAVVNGPGSYTGIRVGLASAKGICYALKKPYITIGSLPLMSKAAFIHFEKDNQPVPLLCPMIDARRLEVFTAMYNADLKEIFPAQAMQINYNSFVDVLLQNKVLFFGNGALKFKALTNHPNALFAGEYNSSQAFCELSYHKFIQQEFSDIAYSEPLYLKEFYNG
jgi:tRNA threonylcarbamoyladenosine biosynthesis protein TsaB